LIEQKIKYMIVIPNTNGLYFASDDGEIFRNGKRIAPINNGNDYLCVVLSIEGKTQRKYIHRLICEAYIANPENKSEVNHIDGNKMNNSLYNLEWATRSENQFHRYKVLKHSGANLGKTGSENGRSKTVYQLDLDGNTINVFESVLEAQRRTGINEASIRGVVYGKQKTAGKYKWKY